MGTEDLEAATSRRPTGLLRSLATERFLHFAPRLTTHVRCRWSRAVPYFCLVAVPPRRGCAVVSSGRHLRLPRPPNGPPCFLSLGLRPAAVLFWWGPGGRVVDRRRREDRNQGVVRLRRNRQFVGRSAPREDRIHAGTVRPGVTRDGLRGSETRPLWHIRQDQFGYANVTITDVFRPTWCPGPPPAGPKTGHPCPGEPRFAAVWFVGTKTEHVPARECRREPWRPANPEAGIPARSFPGFAGRRAPQAPPRDANVRVCGRSHQLRSVQPRASDRPKIRKRRGSDPALTKTGLRCHLVVPSLFSSTVFGALPCCLSLRSSLVDPVRSAD